MLTKQYRIRRLNRFYRFLDMRYDGPTTNNRRIPACLISGYLSVILHRLLVSLSILFTRENNNNLHVCIFFFIILILNSLNYRCLSRLKELILIALNAHIIYILLFRYPIDLH